MSKEQPTSWLYIVRGVWEHIYTSMIFKAIVVRLVFQYNSIVI